MTDSEEKTIINGIIDELLELAKHYSDIFVIDADLSRATKTIRFRTEFPERHINMGISEQDMVGFAAGLSSCNFVPFISSFATFLTGNAFSQIRLHCGIEKRNIKLLGFNAGLSPGPDGASHQGIDDCALMLAIPGMRIIQPYNYFSARYAVIESYSSEYEGPVYIRISRSEEKNDTLDKLTAGTLHTETLIPGEDLYIIATGPIIYRAYDAVKILQNKGISCGLTIVSKLSLNDSELQQKIIFCAQKSKRLLVCEEHYIFGGLGSLVEHICSASSPALVKKIGLSDYCSSGTEKELVSRYNLRAQDIVESALDLFE